MRRRDGAFCCGATKFTRRANFFDVSKIDHPLTLLARLHRFRLPRREQPHQLTVQAASGCLLAQVCRSADSYEGATNLCHCHLCHCLRSFLRGGDTKCGG